MQLALAPIWFFLTFIYNKGMILCELLWGINACSTEDSNLPVWLLVGLQSSWSVSHHPVNGSSRLRPLHPYTCDLLVLVAQLCPTLCDPTDRLLCPWTLQARIPEWVAILFSRGSSQPRDWTQIEPPGKPTSVTIIQIKAWNIFIPPPVNWCLPLKSVLTLIHSKLLFWLLSSQIRVLYSRTS